MSETVPTPQAPGAARAGSSLASDWESYSRGRPTYPESLEKLITEYHCIHSNLFRVAHDIGAGSGVYSSTLAKHFQHVHVSDINEKAVETAKESLGRWQRESGWNGAFSFATTPAEEADSCVPDRSIDLAVLMEAAHWTDADTMVRSFAQSLAPNGTLAIVYYSPICSVMDNEIVNDAVQRLFNAWSIRPVRDVVSRGQRKVCLGLDFVPLPEGLFYPELTRRITINTRGRGRDAFMVPGLWHSLPIPESTFDHIKVDPREQIFEYSEDDQEGKGWQQDVKVDFFRREISTLVHNEEALKAFEPYILEIERLVEESSSTVTIKTEWTVAVLLATRK